MPPNASRVRSQVRSFRGVRNRLTRVPRGQVRAAVGSSALGVTGGTKRAWVRSAQNRLTRVPRGQGRAVVGSSELGVTGGTKRSWVRSAQNRLTRVPLGKARAAVRSSALGVTGGTVQRAITSNSTTPALSVYRGTLACRHRVKRFRQARAAVAPRRCAFERVGRDRWYGPTRHHIQQYDSGVERVPGDPSLSATG